MYEDESMPKNMWKAVKAMRDVWMIIGVFGIYTCFFVGALYLMHIVKAPLWIVGIVSGISILVFLAIDIRLCFHKHSSHSD